jgi:hypothetical protein
MTIFKSLLFLFFLSLISTVNSAYACKPSDTQKSVEIGNEVTLCLHARTLGKKVAFKIKVDDYSVISIEEGFSKLITSENSGSRRLDARNLIKEGEDDPGESSAQTSGDSTTPPTETPTTPPTETPTTPPTETPTTPPTEAPTTPPTEAPTNPPTEVSKTNPYDGEVNEGIKEEFIAQIGNVRTKYPTVI